MASTDVHLHSSVLPSGGRATSAANGHYPIESSQVGGATPGVAPGLRRSSALRSEASRQNGRKSRGPKTEEGKKLSRRNALKHGLRAETLLLEAGSEQENSALQKIRARLEEQFVPQTIEQQLLLESLVHALWQKQRGLQFEARELRQDLVFHGPVMDRILRYATAADRRFLRSLQELKRLQEECADGQVGQQ